MTLFLSSSVFVFLFLVSPLETIWYDDLVPDHDYFFQQKK